MTLTTEERKELMDMVRQYQVLNMRGLSGETLELAKNLILGTYTEACSKLEVARKVHAAVMRNEERYPTPATIRKYLREMNYVELDADTETGR